jgi:hypothetical protein
MKVGLRLLLLLCAALGLAGVAHARTFNQAELDALLAPIALYPDPVLSNVLDASQYPDEVRAAAAWTRENPQLKGDDALRALGPAPWQPSVKALTAFPDVLARMDESPQWLQDLGEAYSVHGPYVMDTVQQLRRRAQANGNLQSTDQQRVYDDNGAIAVQPAYPGVVYVPYYDPFVVYGGWWWPAYRPVVFRPWPVFGVRVSFGYFPARFDWRARHVVVVNRPVIVNRPIIVNHQGHSGPGPAHAVGHPQTPARTWRSAAPAPRPQIQAQSQFRQPTQARSQFRQPMVRSMAPAGWRAESGPQSYRGASRPQGGMHGGHRG